MLARDPALQGRVLLFDAAAKAPDALSGVAKTLDECQRARKKARPPSASVHGCVLAGYIRIMTPEAIWCHNPCMPRQHPIQLSNQGVSVDDVVRTSGETRRFTLNRLSALHQSGRARRLSRGVYARADRDVSALASTKTIDEVVEILNRELPGLEPVVSSTGQLAPLMHNTLTREIAFVEVGRQFVPSVVEALTGAGLIAQPVRVRADMDRLLSLPGDRFIAVLGVSDQRGAHGHGARVAGSERALVNLIVGRARFGLPLYQEDIVESARALMGRYDFSLSTAYDYARRRGDVALGATRSLLSSVITSDPDLAPYRKAL